MDLYRRVADLPLMVEGHRLELLRAQVSSGFARVTTLVTLSGRGLAGLGEDVTYDADTHEAVLAEQSALPLAGPHTIASFSALLERYLPATEVPYQRWAFESAALDLAMRQAGLTLPAVFGRDLSPLRFLVSTRLGEPPSDTLLRGWLSWYPWLEFKLDPQSSWTPELFASLAAMGRIRVLDLKSAYQGTPVDQPFDATLYSRVRDLVVASPEIIYIEDPFAGEEGLAALAGAERRLSWDAVIHCVADIEALSIPPGAINIKPSRFGSLERLLDTVEHCLERGIHLYGGGQFELGPGRDQIQALASLFYADSANDVAPGGFNLGDPRPGLPASPLLPPAVPAVGFCFQRT